MHKKLLVSLGVFLSLIVVNNTYSFAINEAPREYDEYSYTINVYENGKPIKHDVKIGFYECQKGTSISNCELGFRKTGYYKGPSTETCIKGSCKLYYLISTKNAIGVTLNGVVYYDRSPGKLNYNHTYILDVTNGVATLKKVPMPLSYYTGTTKTFLQSFLILIILPILFTFLIKIPVILKSLPKFKERKKIFVQSSIISSLIAFNLSLVISNGINIPLASIIALVTDTAIYTRIFKNTEYDFKIRSLIGILLITYILNFIIATLLFVFYRELRYMLFSPFMPTKHGALNI